MATELRKTGIAAVGDMPWGTHFCHFYQTPQDLLDTVVPFLKAGLESKELCLWVTSQPLSRNARKLLRQAIPGIDRHVEAGNIEILSYAQWYLDGDIFDAQRVIDGWDRKLGQALDNGYAGLRAAADEAWLGKKYWQAFADYEGELDQPIACRPMIVMCAYPLASSEAGAIFDVARTHQFATAERNGNWQTLETPALKHAKAELKHLNEELEARVVARTGELEASNAALRQEMIQNQRAHEALRQSQQLLQAIIDNTTAVVYIKDLQGRYLLINRRYEEVFHTSRESVLGRTDFDIFPPEQAEAFRAFDRQVLEAGTALEAEEVASQDDGLHTYISIKCPLFGGDGEPYAICGISTDITERKRTEDERQARQAAENANRAKSEFLANMSHELRSPLNTILGFAQLLSRDNLPEKARRDLDIILHSGEHLHKLINQVLDLAKIEAGRATLDLARCDMHHLFGDLETMFARVAEDRGLTLILEQRKVPRFIQADGMKLRQVLINLLSNAFKFTAAGQVTLQAQGSTPVGRLAFAVADTGPGISAAEQRQLFDAFVQAEAGRRTEGSGLGLTISRSFVHLMGGELRIDSSPGQGTTVAFEIPVQAVTEQLAAEARGRVVALAPREPRRRLLVVDDQAEARELLIRLLDPLGFELKEATDGLEAVELCRIWQPDLVWMDMCMPGVDGREATRRIKAAGPRAPVVVALTASVYEVNRGEIQAAGCDGLLHKPVRPEDLFDQLERHLGVHFLREEGLPSPTSLQLEARDLAALPAALRKQMEEALVRLDTAAVNHALDAIRPHDSRLAQSLAALAGEFQYEQMLQLIQGAAVQCLEKHACRDD